MRLNEIKINVDSDVILLNLHAIFFRITTNVHSYAHTHTIASMHEIKNCKTKVGKINCFFTFKTISIHKNSVKQKSTTTI